MGSVDAIDVKVGDTFEIVLEAQRGAGFKWVCSPSPKTAKHLVLVNEAVDADPGRPGSPSTQRFEFRALAAGQILLGFEYRRPWESGKARARRVVRVEIKPT